MLGSLSRCQKETPVDWAYFQFLRQANKTETNPASQSTTAAPQSDTAPQVPVKQGNIFISKGAPKLPFDFARSDESAQGNQAPLNSRVNSSAWLWSRIEAYFPGFRTLLLGWPFRTCLELQSVCDLPHVRLVTQAVHGRCSRNVLLIAIGISQMVVHSATEDNLGLVQWDIGVLLNCLCSTLKTLESYPRSAASNQRHTLQGFLHQTVLLSEQDILAKALKLAISDIVRVFGRYLDQTGLDSETADVCQRIWDGEFL